MVVVNAIIRCLLCPHWWFTVATIANKHSTQHSIPYQQALSLCVVESFVVIVERSFRTNFGDIPPLSNEDRDQLAAVTAMSMVHWE